MTRRRSAEQEREHSISERFGSRVPFLVALTSAMVALACAPAEQPWSPSSVPRTRAPHMPPTPSPVRVPVPEAAAASTTERNDASDAAPAKPQLADLVRRRAWSEVEEQLEALTEKPPLQRYLLARAAFERGHHAIAADRYARSRPDPDLQSFVEEELLLARVRAAQLEALPKNWYRKVDAAEILTAAERLVNEGRLDEAAPIIDQAARRARGKDDDGARLHAVRARWAWAKEFRYRAYVDWRWLVTETPLHFESEPALTHLQAGFPNHSLSAKDFERRTQKFSEAGRPSVITRELERWTATRGGAPSASERLHYQGMAYYSQRDYPAAAPLLLQAAELRGRFARSDRYYAARSLSRQGKQSDAIIQYGSLMKTAAKSRTGHLAAFRYAREHSFVGDWTGAVEAYSDFIDHHPGSEFMETALRERAVARYANGELAKAAFEFKRLRYLRPRSRFAPLYLNLEGLALLGTEKATEGFDVLKKVAQEHPLNFAGISARLRLTQFGHPAPALEPQEKTDGAVPTLPPSVAALEQAGLFEHAETLLRRKEAGLRGLERFLKFEAECAAFDQLLTGRRQLLLGLSAARSTGFFSQPGRAPLWVWRCLHPTPFQPWVQSSADEFDVPPTLVYAIMRQESGFRPHVVSSAEARGLMQVIPPTAVEIATALDDMPDHGKLDYDAPHRNIRYGTYYLGVLLRAFNEHPALAAAGYNAGPSAAGLWFAAGRHLPLELFVARIPYDETRNYVMRVLQNLVAYQQLDPESETAGFPLDFGG